MIIYSYLSYILHITHYLSAGNDKNKYGSLGQVTRPTLRKYSRWHTDQPLKCDQISLFINEMSNDLQRERLNIKYIVIQ